MSEHKIIYTHTDEAPALATVSFLPIIQAFSRACGIPVETRDISLAARVLAAFQDKLPEGQRVSDDLAELGELAKTPYANIIKLPNISASVPQLEATIAELQAKGYALPAYPQAPANDEERDIKQRYDRVKGSAVNPVLREGNSDRRAPGAVKAFAKKNPHSMGAWSKDSQSHVATMDSGDFRHNEKSVTISGNDTLRIEHVAADGTVTVMKDGITVGAGDVVDSTYMSKSALLSFLDAQIEDARSSGILFSLHMKATMMKVSDPIIFGHAVRRYFKNLFEAHGDAITAAGGNASNGFGDILAAIESMDESQKSALSALVDETYGAGPDVAMVDSDRGITNLHVPSDIIIDASMPAMIRSSGQMWNKAGALQDAKAVIPDSSYASLYQAVIEDCKAHGAFDPTTMGTVPNVGLMAQKAEEYGSHDKTFELDKAGTMRVVNGQGETLMSHEVEAGDIWRACQVKNAAIIDWIQLALRRARATSTPAVFWLDATRAHDAQLINIVNAELAKSDTSDVTTEILSVAEATHYTLNRIRKGEDTISVTGNVLRDYLTDLFPIMELGTSAKMLSIVPLMNGGGLFETGAGGSAPKHVQQLVKENYLRWDSLGEFLALAVSYEHFADAAQNSQARILASALDKATERLLDEGRSPSRKVGGLDNRGSHFYIALYWAQEMASQTDDAALASTFAPLANGLAETEATIVAELNGVQGQAAELGGYYSCDQDKTARVMRPSATLNRLVDGFAIN